MPADDHAHPAPGFARIQLQDEDQTCRWLQFQDPVRVLPVLTHGDVLPALGAAADAAGHGRYVVCYISYEASPAFDTAYAVHPPDAFPLAWIGIYDTATPIPPPTAQTGSMPPAWTLNIARPAYQAALERIHAWIAAGDTYQVNFTTRLTAPFHGSPSTLFAELLMHQPRGYAAYLDTGSQVICSLSPELFFALDGDRITCRPMKGTATRGVTNQQDRERALTLRTCEKNRAENVMIVDMVRNDLGRIARAGSISVDRLYDIERYRTVLQMTSTVTARTSASLPEIFRGLFPCASITGAPKIRSMEIIRDLESTPRGIYTGCIGLLQPGRKAQFNVAIRTVHIDRGTETATYGTGGGIVWDSTASSEYRECQAKALVLRPPPAHLHLLETLLWVPKQGYRLREEHIDRLLDSATYFDIQVSRKAVENALEAQVVSLRPVPQRVRMLVAENGTIRIEHTPVRHPPFCDDPGQCVVDRRVARAPRPVDPANRFLYHKTTHRNIYDRARAAAPEAEDVILWNTRGEWTESCVANLVVRVGNRWLTPPVSCGLLGGTYRRALLDAGRIEESVLSIDCLPETGELYLINSVRGWVRARLQRNGRG